MAARSPVTVALADLGIREMVKTTREVRVGSCPPPKDQASSGIPPAIL